eukprot:CCRYP_012523-RA/>CCRYP_012523-RA protein AED:0.38 eAED:0.38 QI:0/0/0/1/0/0/2/0/220
MINYRQLIQHPTLCNEWTLSSANEFGWLAQGVGGCIKGTNTIKFIAKSNIPFERRKDITYDQFVCTIQNKSKIALVLQLVATPTAKMITAKILFNSVISTPGARFMTMVISNFYLMTPLKCPEYLHVKLRDIPDKIIREYNLTSLADPDGPVYILVQLYGLPQAGLLANELLKKRLNAHGYFQSKLVPSLWRHKQRPIQFSLMVDDFGIKYTGREHAEHL